MLHSVKESLVRWNEQTTDRQKLQHAYAGVATVLVLAAGVLGLLNHSLGQQVLAVSIASAAIFLINAVAWALLQSFILLRLAVQPKSEKHPVTRKK